MAFFLALIISAFLSLISLSNSFGCTSLIWYAFIFKVIPILLNLLLFFFLAFAFVIEYNPFSSVFCWLSSLLFSLFIFLDFDFLGGFFPFFLFFLINFVFDSLSLNFDFWILNISFFSNSAAFSDSLNINFDISTFNGVISLYE